MNFAQDIRFAFRTLRKSPGFLAIAVLTLSLGISANTAIFSLFHQVLLRSLPVANPERLVVFHADEFQLPGTGSSDNFESIFSYPMYRTLRSARSFVGVAARTSTAVQMLADNASDRVKAEVVSGNFFDVLGVRAQAGRLLNASDDTFGAGNPVAVLSHDYWIKRFGGTAVLNRSVTLNNRPFTIVGIAPDGFRGVLSGSAPALYVPLAMLGAVSPGWEKYDSPDMSRFTLLGRLAANATRRSAEAELEPLFAAALRDQLTTLKVTGKRARQRLESKRLQLLSASQGLNELERQWKKPLIVLASMVSLLLLIGCANLANLLLARGVNRSRDTAIRLALGAGRKRIASMLLAESCVVAVAGALVGLLLTPILTAAVLRLLPEDQSSGWLSAGVSLPVLAFCTALMMLSAIVSGLAPAWQSSRTRAGSVLSDRSSASTGGHLSPRIRQALVVGQLAFSLVLLSVAGLFGRSLLNLLQHNPGFRAENVLTFSVDAGAGGYSVERALALYRTIGTRLAAQPNVDSVSIADASPLSGDETGNNVSVEAYTPGEAENMGADTNSVGPGFFRTLGTPLLQGREFTEKDVIGADKVAIVNQAFVRRYLKGRHAVDARMEKGAHGTLDLRIVGVVADIKNLTLREEVKPTFYLPYEQSKVKADTFRATFFVRTRKDAAAFTPTARTIVSQLDRTLPVFEVATMQTRIDDSIYTDRLLAALSTAFGLLALLLTAVGLYGVISYVVSRRTAEIGLRMALGATSANVVGLVLREVGLLVAAGVASGVLVSFGAMQVVRSELFGMSAFDPAVLAMTTAILAAVALAAGAVPAIRAARVQPLLALRHD